MGAARSLSLRFGRRLAGLAFAVSAVALLAACETAPTPAEIAAMDWQGAARVDTPPAYQAYMRMHPDGQYVGVAQTRIAELERIEADSYSAARRIDTEDAYVGFLARFPWGLHANEADARRATLAAPRLAAEENRDWIATRDTGRIEMFEAFLESWPNAAHSAEARARLDALWRTDQGAFVRARRAGSPGELQAFMRAWPRSPFVQDAQRELDLIYLRDDEAWRRAMADNSVAGYDFYLSSQPWGRWRVEASRSIADLRERDYQAWRYAAALDQIWAYENYRMLYPWGGWYDTAFYRIDWIRGGRDWNRWNSGWNYGWDRGWRWGDYRQHEDRDREEKTYPPLFRRDADNLPNTSGQPSPGGRNDNPAPPSLWENRPNEPRGGEGRGPQTPSAPPVNSQPSPPAGGRYGSPPVAPAPQPRSTPPPAPPPPPPPPQLAPTFGDKAPD